MKARFFGMQLAYLIQTLNIRDMKKKSRKNADGQFETRGFDAQVYHNYDLEMKLVQNINKEKPVYSLD